VIHLLLLLVLAGGAAAEPVSLGQCGPVARTYEAVELPAGRLRRLGGTPVDQVGVLAFRDGHAVPIPSQVDERRGRKLALPGGREPSADDRPGVLDGEDLIVFMPCDAGERRSAAEVEAALAASGPVRAWREVRVDDPVEHTSAWAYVVIAEPPPATERRYVAYASNADLITAARYRIGLVNALPNYFSVALAGAPGPNLIDGLRLRAEATLRANLAHWTLNETQGHHELVAWKEGPVRVIRRSRHQVAVGLGIHLTAGIAHTYFYPQHVFGPGSMKLPFSPGVLFRDITAFGGADARDLRGWRYHAPGVPPKGFLVDGRMEDAERAFAEGGDWFVLARHETALLFVTRMSENLARAVPLRLVYRDDAERDDPPETSRGQVPLVGYQARGVERLPGGRYTFSLRVFALGRYRRGDEARIVAHLDTPVSTDVTGEESPTAPAAAADPAAARR
jgi:hypothetical protein